ncbi:hypothetical protein DB30_06795 [Enhygromyxa salina]|uniref:Uncharacterized protein n=1 Tax=Enhygromyxa salina TaxID=215803 RepID=A0A0C2D2S7_9BACT|nr:hypothetical protein [Enhygromyxa salina]KIG14452.1 hypothetical protein DB30_06795 [Enhygromyxa salina]
MAPGPDKASDAKQTRSQAKAARKSAAPRQGPTLTEAELLGEGEHLRLHFSEPLAPTDRVDPNDFRLSMAMVYSYKMYAYAYYYDPGLAEGEELMVVTSMRGQGDTLDLYLSPPFELAYCEELRRELADMQSEPGVRADGGVFLHYAPGEVPITDLDGNHMAAVAAEWVLHRRRGTEDPEEMYFEGPPARRALREPIRVRCGPRLPPGPR